MAYGDIGSVIDTLVFNAAGTELIDFVHVSGTVWMLAYQQNGSGIKVKTVDIASDGMIVDTPIDSCDIRGGSAQNPCIFHVTGNIYCIADKLPNGVPTVTTFECLTNGQITEPIKDDWNWDQTSFSRQFCAERSSSLFTLAYEGPNNYGMLATLSIDSGGTITDPLVDQVTFDSPLGTPWGILEIRTGIYALVYNAGGPTGVLITFSVDSDGDISDPYIDKLIFATPSGTALSIAHAGSDIYVLGHVRAGSYPWLTTVSISQAGDISASSLDDLQVLAFACGKPQVHYIAPGIIAYALRGASGDGFIYTFTIDTDDGSITATPISSLEFDGTNCDLPVIFDISHGIYAIAYKGPSDHGYLKTLGISTPLHLVDHTPMTGIGP